MKSPMAAKMNRFERPMVSKTPTFFLAGAILTLCASTFARDYLVVARIEGQNGKLITCPRITVPANKQATCSITDEAIEYQLKVKAGDDTDKAIHQLEVRAVATDVRGLQSILMNCRVTINSNKEATIKAGDMKIKVQVDAVERDGK